MVDAIEQDSVKKIAEGVDELREMDPEEGMEGLKEFIQRSLDGPVMAELEYDLKLSRQLRLLTSEYSIHFKPEAIVCDDATADAIWQAALELLERVGVYNVDTNRVVLLPREVVETAAARAPKEFTVGEGKDAVTIKARAHDSKTPPVILAIPGKSFRHKGGMQTFVNKTLEASISDAGPLGELSRKLRSELEGIPYLAEIPGEMMWARAVVRWQRTVAGMLGKPGLWLIGAQATSPPAVLGCYTGHGLLNKFNSHISAFLMPELKLRWDSLRLSYAAQTMGVYRFCAAAPVLGGYCRNNEEAAIVSVATALGFMVYASDKKVVHLNVVDRQGNYTGRGPLQAASGARRATERHLTIPIHCNQNTKNGLGTKLGLYELAALVLAQTGSGMAWNGRGLACAPGPDGEYTAELDWKFVTRICRGAAGLSREKTNQLVTKLLPFYEDQVAVDEGKPFDRCYDMKTLTPSAELAALYDGMEDELRSLGIPMG